MKNLKLILFLITTLIIFHSCNKCKNLDCAANNYSGQFRIVKIADGKDLVFGADKIYDKNQIKFYSLNGIDTTFLDYKPIKFANSGYDSILYVNFLPKIDIAYRKLRHTGYKEIII